MKFFYGLMGCLVLFQSLSAQNNILKYTIKGSIISEKNNKIEQANITLHKAVDSALVKITFTNEQGLFEFVGITEGAYFIKIAHVGYQPYSSTSLQLTMNNEVFTLSPIQLKLKPENLKEVTVQSFKPLIEKKVDRIIINVENSIISAGASAMEVLEHAPGITIDQNGGISINGKLNALVMIDGRLSANSLKILSSNDIEKIEIITNPSVRYDAAGSAGIINIRMKKNQKLGLNGTATASYGQGVYEKINPNFSLNYRSKKWNFFGNYTFNFRKNFDDISQYRKLLNNAQLFNVYDQYIYIIAATKANSSRIGADYFLNKSTTIGLLFEGAFSSFHKTGNNETDIYNNNMKLDGRFNTKTLSNEDWKNGSGNLNFKHSFDDKGKELNIDLNIASYTSHKDQDFTTHYFNTLNALTKTDTLIGKFDGMLDMRSVKIDYTHPISENVKINIGMKSGFVKTDNDVQFLNKINGINIFDANKSNHFIYYENVNAGYVDYNQQNSKWLIDIGLRVEQTIANGRPLSYGQPFHRNYVQLFPSLFINQTISNKHTLSYSISRRIDRPDYQQLNPFKLFYDPTTYDEGNPTLIPQLTSSIEITHTYNEKFITTLTYSRTKDNIAYVVIQNPEDAKKSVLAIRNIDKLDYYGLNINTPIKFTKWWNMNNNLTVFYNDYKGEVVGIYFENNRVAVNENMIHTFTLPKNWSAELSCLYNSGSVYAISPYQSLYRISIGIQKTIMQRKGTVRLSIRDIFHSQITRASTKFANIDETFKQITDTRVATLSFTYRFGKRTITAARNRETGLEAEQNRNQMGNK